MEFNKKIAIVYDWIDKWGGVERVLLTLHRMFPEAVFYTSYFDPGKVAWAKDLKIKTSFIQKLPEFIKKSRIMSLPFYPFAFESFNFNEFDLVISVTSSFAKSVITKPKTKHICYLLTPTRFLWSHQQDYFKKNAINNCYFKQLKNWDFVTAYRPDRIISISQTTADRCIKYYHRQSEVIYPPFNVEYWNNIKSKVKEIPRLPRRNVGIARNDDGASKKFFLVVSRLEPYKKVDLVVQLINQLDIGLIVVGEGSEEKKLKKMVGKNVTFLSKLTDQELASLYSTAEALIMPQEEDFGLVSLEAQFFGCPVIAYKKGGASETVIDEKTGIFFDNQNQKSLGKAIERFNKIKYNLRNNVREFGLKNVERFNEQNFINSFMKII